MLANFTRNYVYVASQKVGSEAFHLAAGYAADIAYSRIGRRKHMKFTDIPAELARILGEPVDFTRLVVIGTVRHPVSWLLSWYNSRARKALAAAGHPNHASYTGGVPVSQFIDEAVSAEPPQRASFPRQARFFDGLDAASGQVQLLDFDRQAEQVGNMTAFFDPDVARFLGAKRINASRNKLASAADIGEDQARTILDAFAEDYRLYRIASGHDGRLKDVRTDRDYGARLQAALQEAVAREAGREARMETLVGRYTSELAHGREAAAEALETTLRKEFGDADINGILAGQRRRYKF